MYEASMSLPSHITAPLIGCVTTCGAVFAMGSLVGPLLQGPEPTGRSLTDGASTVTLSPALRARDELMLAGAATGDTRGALTRSLLTGTGPAAALPQPGATVTLPAATLPGTTSQSGEANAIGTPEQETATGGENAGISGGLPAESSARPNDPATGPALAAPGTTVVDLPAGTVTPPADAGPKRFTLRVVGLERTDDQVRVKVAIASGGDAPASTMTIALKPSALTPVDGQAVKVSLDVVTGDTVDDTKLRVRVTLVEDTTGGEPVATEGGDSGTSNVVDIAVPVAPAETPDPGEEPVPPTDPAGGELLITLGTETSSEGTAATPEVSVGVSVTPDPPAPPPTDPPTVAPTPDPPAATDAPAPSPDPGDGQTASEPVEAQTGPVVESSTPSETTSTTAAPAEPVQEPEPAPAPTPATPAPEATADVAPAPAPAEAPAPAPEPAQEPAPAPVEPAPSPVPAETPGTEPAAAPPVPTP